MISSADRSRYTSRRLQRRDGELPGKGQRLDTHLVDVVAVDVAAIGVLRIQVLVGVVVGALSLFIEQSTTRER
jgi:hypothetical protein